MALHRSVLSVLLAALMFPTIGGSAVAADKMVFDLPAFDAQGHRGARGLRPENSLPAFDVALSIGVTTLELDTVVTKDSVVVVHHDRRLYADRTRDESGKWLEEPTPAFNSLNFDELAGYDIGTAKPGGKVAKRFPDQESQEAVRIPALAEVLKLGEERSGGKIRYNIETKISPLAPGETPDPAIFARLLVETIQAAGIDGGRAAVQSFDWRTLVEVQKIAPEIPTVYLTAEQRWLDNVARSGGAPSPWTAGTKIGDADDAVPAAVAALGGAVWSPYHKDLSDTALKAAQSAGLKVVVWTVNNPADMAALIDRGVDGIITDYPDRLRKVAADKGLDLPPSF
ncbi:glycerophosphodiester phosphodiesterase family protein [Pelagibius sp. Alg239-R121]|uniref:glycerophosphodiester phosphodiesterase family protein n=1 Tax=Pelagibius sp. Alg239-R121 TaxID=2993448 RepID=UPI0024A6168A|nr:glycerophosphodiester phosphodiesterase family protein [Pelagibius sp. Alg239-R121]